ncbi:set domain-containing protein 5 protein [Apiospora kogelbergensis]|uniref:set domain-containing protein 5 protein n=1 Tax=Apiospora kogelbergensis TaxID=1337665 RepID=UPI003130D874
MSGSEEIPDIRLNPLCTARYLGENKGYGVVATRDIQEGAVILRDIAAVVVDNEDTLAMSAQRDINRQYTEMSEGDKARFDSLHFFMSPQNRVWLDEQALLKPTEALRAEFVTNFEHALTFATNCFDVGTSVTQACLFFNASRFNHACLPSAEYNVFQGPPVGNRPAPVRWEAYARRDIKEGEEITIAYNYRQYERERRQRDLLAVWGFPCDCEVCDLEGDDQGAKSREFDANLQNLYSDEAFWGRTLWVSRNWDREQLDNHIERLEERAGLSRAVGNQEILFKT